ncbi:hypothetical protein Peur_021049 [Populus x canadensis]
MEGAHQACQPPKSCSSGFEFSRQIDILSSHRPSLKGRHVIIEKSRGLPKVTKDGVTVAKSIKFKEKAKSVGADLVKQVANATNSATGDGTTCATVQTQAILPEGCKSVSAGVNVMDLRSGINIAVGGVLSDLKKRALMISTLEEITQVATISEMVNVRLEK